MIKIAKVESAKHGNFSVFIFLICIFAMYGFGVFSMVDIISNPSPDLMPLIDAIATLAPFLVAGLPALLIFLLIMFIVVFIMSWVILQIMKRTGTFVVIVMAYLIPLGIMGVGVLLLPTVALSLLGIILIGIGGLFLLLAVWQHQKLRRSGKFIEFSASLVLDEKALLFAPIILAVFTMFTGIIMGFSYLEIWDTWGVVTEGLEPEIQQIGSIVGLVIEYIYLIVYFALYYIIVGFIVSYAFDWYRTKDPSLGTAWKDVKQVLAPIIWFGIIRATLEMLTRIIGRGARQASAKSRRGQEQIGTLVFFAIAAVITSIFIGLYRFFTYFTLPAIVIKKKGLRDSIRDSARMVWESWLDIMVGETGFGLAMFFFNILNLIIWTVTGFLLGYLPSQDFVSGIVFGILLLILSTIPMSIVSMPMGAAFKTFLYAYALDRSTGFKQPSRLPSELKGELNTAIQDFERRDARRKIPQPSF